MSKMKLEKIYAGCALALALTMAAGPVSVFADVTTGAAVNTVNPGKTAEEKAAKAAEATSRGGITLSATDDPATAGVDETKNDTVIDVWAFTADATVYSVDVEWGAMTFEYEVGSWDPETHQAKEGAGWQVYDNTSEKALGDVQDAINRVTVTNHSNAPVYASLSYAGETGYDTTTGLFATTDASKKTAANTAADVKATWDDTNKFLTLQTAATNASGSAITAGETGAPAVGNVYFMPTGIADAQKTDNGIAQWTTIGKITVTLSTTAPTAP